MPSEANKPAVTVWTATVDGRKMTIIDPFHATLKDMRRNIEQRFGKDRVASVKKQ